MNKVVIVLFVAVVGVAISKPLSDDEHEKLHKLNQECAKTSGLDEETLKKFKDDVDFPDVDKIKVHAKCFMKGLGIMDDEGKIDVDALTSGLKHILPEGKEEELVKKCNIEKDNAEETAVELGKCIHNEIHP